MQQNNDGQFLVRSSAVLMVKKLTYMKMIGRIRGNQSPICEGNHRLPMNSLDKGQVKRSFGIFVVEQAVVVFLAIWDTMMLMWRHYNLCAPNL